MIGYISYNEWMYLVNNCSLLAYGKLTYQLYSNKLVQNEIVFGYDVEFRQKAIYESIKRRQRLSGFKEWLLPDYIENNLKKYRRKNKIQQIKQI